MEIIRDAGPKLKSFFYYTCKPENPDMVKGSVLVLHGAEGYGGRYEPFGNELVKNGYAMFAIDHIGHGRTVLDEKDGLGKWDSEDFHYSAYNAYYLVDCIKKMYPGKPVYILGDDYGGTMAQYMLGEFDLIFDGVIISSCGMPSFRDKKMFAKLILKKKLLYDGGRSKGTFKSRTRFLNAYYKPNRTKYDWLNSDPDEVDRFIDDPLAGYVGTLGYYYYQYKYIVHTPSIAELKKVKKDFPVLMLGGKEDHITHCGKQVLLLKDYYVKKGFTNVDVILYEGSRHDVLLERNKGEVAQDIAKWMEKNSLTNSKGELQIATPEVVKAEVVCDNEVETSPSMEAANGVTFKEEDLDELRISNEIKK